MPLPRIHCDQRLGPGAQFALAPEAAQHVGRAQKEFAKTLSESDQAVLARVLSAIR